MTDCFNAYSSDSSELIIHNVCGRFSINYAPLDLRSLSSKILNARYNPHRIPAIIIRKTRPRATVLLFGTGRALVIGTESIAKMQEISQRIAREVGSLLGVKNMHAEKVEVTNIMAVATLGKPCPNEGFRIDLGKLSEHPRVLKYENLPGAVYQLSEPIKKVMVHRNGKLILWGAKTLNDMNLAFEIMKRKMKDFAWMPALESSDEFNKGEFDVADSGSTEVALQ